MCGRRGGVPHLLASAHALRPGGLGRLIAFLGASALGVTLVAAVAVGSHMSRDEALLGIVPAVLLIVVGGLSSLRRAQRAQQRR